MSDRIVASSSTELGRILAKSPRAFSSDDNPFRAALIGTRTSALETLDGAEKHTTIETGRAHANAGIITGFLDSAGVETEGILDPCSVCQAGSEACHRVGEQIHGGSPNDANETVAQFFTDFADYGTDKPDADFFRGTASGMTRIVGAVIRQGESDVRETKRQQYEDDLSNVEVFPWEEDFLAGQ